MTTSLLDQAIAQASRALLARQKADGSWTGEVELNPGPTAQAVMLHAALRRDFPAELAPKARRYIERTQNGDGGWSPFEGASSEVSLACECYFALRLLGRSPHDPSVARALSFIRASGGLVKANPWTQLYAAVLGVAPWNLIYKTPIEILLIPRWAPVQLKDLSYWVKVITIPMALLGDVGPGEPIALAPTLREELRVRAEDWTENPAAGLAEKFAPQLLALVKKLPLNREEARRRGWQEIADFTEANGDFGGNSCTAINVLLGLDRTGQRDTQRFERGFAAFMSYAVETEDEWRLQTCQSHVWDTGFALCALPAEAHPEAEERGRAWLHKRQILDVRGDWARNTEAEPGGWCFGNHHDHFPVTDCTALALLGLVHGKPNEVTQPRAHRGVDWLLAMQHRGGGWSAYEKYERGAWLNQVVKFKDLENALVDLPKADVSAKVLEALVPWRKHHPKVESALAGGREFLLRTRETDGVWRGNYGINTIYGTAFACKALRAIDGAANDQWAQPVRSFLLARQNEDGGWGEAEASYRDSSLRGRGDSSVVQTAWALLALIACRADERDDDQLGRGLRFLLDRQRPDGTWEEPKFLGTVFPGMVYFRYELYALYFPLMALTAAATSRIHGRAVSTRVT